jgi:DNA helicase IV
MYRFRYLTGFWGHGFGTSGLREVSLDNDSLVLRRKAGEAVMLRADNILPPIQRKRGLFWSAIKFRTTDGRDIRFDGIRVSESKTLVREIEAWIAPARAAHFDRVRKRLSDLGRAREALLSSKAYVRVSSRTAKSVEWSEVLEAVLKDLAAVDAPTDLVEAQRVGEGWVKRLAEDVERANEAFVAAELERFKAFFDEVESQPLTPAQRRACIVDDDHDLVLAGAGTGKTSVVIGRLGYLARMRGVDPTRVLILAYNRDAAVTLRERAANRLGEKIAGQAEIRTFHAFGKELIAEVHGVQPDISVLAEDAHQLKRWLSDKLDELLGERGYRRAFIDYGLDPPKQRPSVFSFSSMDEYFEAMDRSELRTLRGERVKSFEELRIANFLTRHGVRYEYERKLDLAPANRQHRSYRPDFTLFRSEGDLAPVILEHFGLGQSGQPPSFFTEEQRAEYLQGVVWKRDLWQREGIDCIETTSADFFAKRIYEKLTSGLITKGFVLTPISDDQCLQILRESGFVSEFAEECAGELPLVRDSGLTDAEIGIRVRDSPEELREELSARWALFAPLKRGYEAELKARGEVDFADLILSAADHLERFRVPLRYQHILVDEFQDISGPRARLLLAAQNAAKGAQLTCVGDDWQSIYRFAGSDIGWIRDFRSRVGPGQTTLLDQTFRFNNKIGELAERFVRENPEQTQRTLKSARQVEQSAVSLVATTEPHKGVRDVLRRVNEWSREQGKRLTVFILARYRYELEALREALPKGYAQAFPHLGGVEFRTVHGTKGLEADFVVVIGLERGRNGFPAEKDEDDFAAMFLPPKESFPWAEERRLFYVALTRARHRVYLVHDRNNSSSFVDELARDPGLVETMEFRGSYIQREQIRAPCLSCATGQLIARNGDYGRFCGCSRFPSCRYKEVGCGECGAPLLLVGDFRVCSSPECEGVVPACERCKAPTVYRSGKYGAFYGCSKFGSRDVLEHCTKGSKVMQMPAAQELRKQSLEGSSAGKHGGPLNGEEDWGLQ